CKAPFFWNIFGMIKKLRSGCRRHHCRICGRSLCKNHSNTKVSSSLHGFEIPVRVCSECISKLDNSIPHSLQLKIEGNITQASLNVVTRQLFVTSPSSPIKVTLCIFDFKHVLLNAMFSV
ncbi:hypothetical protein HZS_6806, partial [Henneguya salminicola]